MMVKAKCLAHLEAYDKTYVPGEYIELPEEQAAKLALQGKIIGIRAEQVVEIKAVPYSGMYSREHIKPQKQPIQVFHFGVEKI